MNSRKWIRQKSREHNSVAVLQNLIKELDIKVSKQTAEDVLTANPDYPSLASISESLSDWRVESFPVRLEEEDLSEVTFPAIAYLRPTKKDNEVTIETPRFVMVSEISDNQATYLDPDEGWKSIKRAEFLAQWTGVMLLVEKKPESGEQNYQEARLIERLNSYKLPSLLTVSTLLLTGLIITGILMQGSITQWLPLLLAKIAGVGVSILLLIQLIDKENTVVSKVCQLGLDKRNASGKPASDCGNGLLNSKAATLFGWLSMSEVGAFYFMGGVLSIAIGIFSDALSSVLYLLIVFNLLALPYTVFSIYYQKKHQQWCNLCLAVQAIFWLEFIAGVSIWTASLAPFNFYALTIVAWSFALPVLAWSVLKTGLGRDKEIIELRKQLNLYRRNPAIIKELINNGKKTYMGEIPQEIVLGNPNASFTITLFSNPFCGPCKNAHQQIDELLEDFGDGVRIAYRFSYTEDPGVESGLSVKQRVNNLKDYYDKAADERKTEIKKIYGETTDDWYQTMKEQTEDSESKNSIALTLLSMAHIGDTKTLHEAMSSWYNSEDKSAKAIEQWKAQYPVDKAVYDQMRPSLKASGKWAEGIGIDTTPTIFLDGKEVREALRYIHDIKYYIKAREEEVRDQPYKIITTVQEPV